MVVVLISILTLEILAHSFLINKVRLVQEGLLTGAQLFPVELALQLLVLLLVLFLELQIPFGHLPICPLGFRQLVTKKLLRCRAPEPNPPPDRCGHRPPC